jgi:hypothetical protein
VNRDGWLRREHDEDDQFAGIIYLRKGTSVSPLDKLIMEVPERITEKNQSYRFISAPAVASIIGFKRCGA